MNQNISQKLYDVLGISKNFVRLGIVLMIGKVPSNIVRATGVYFLISVGFGVCIVSLLCAIFLGLFDKRAERFFNKESDIVEKITIKDIMKFPLKYWLLIIICVIYYVTVNPFLGLSV